MEMNIVIKLNVTPEQGEFNSARIKSICDAMVSRIQTLLWAAQSNEDLNDVDGFGSHATVGEVKLIKPGITGTVNAVARSNDGVYDITFNAVRWLANATDDEIIQLRANKWMGTLAEEVAENSADEFSQLAGMFGHILEQGIGFTCVIGGLEAMGWLWRHRHPLWCKLTEEK